MNWFIILALALAGCSKPEPQVKEPEFTRPTMYRVAPMDQAELERIAGEPIPRHFQSPMPLRHILRVEREVKDDLGNLTTAAVKADESLERMVDFAAWVLRRKGMDSEADQIQGEYHTRFSGIMLQIESQRSVTGLRDIGDHTPLLEWLDTWYKKLEGVLGAAVMRATKLEHLKILNYSIPVVFNPSGKNGEWWDQQDYCDHFAGTRHSFFYPAHEHEGFAGVITYWTVWGACTAATYGAGGALPFICSPVGDVSSFVVGKWVAPKISDIIYCRYSVCE